MQDAQLSVQGRMKKTLNLEFVSSGLSFAVTHTVCILKGGQDQHPAGTSAHCENRLSGAGKQ